MTSGPSREQRKVKRKGAIERYAEGRGRANENMNVGSEVMGLCNVRMGL